MSHVWPADDAFDAGSPAYDTGFLLGYMRARPVIIDPAFLSGGTGYGLSSTLWTTGHYLYSGWGSAAASGTSQAASANPTPAANTVPGATSTLPGAWYWRPYSTAADVSVSLSWQTQADSTLIQSIPRRVHIGVGARLSGSTQVSGGTIAAYHDGGDGYWGVLLYDTTLGGKFQLWRVLGGTILMLAQSPVGVTALTWDDVSTWLQRSMELRVTTGVSSVTVELWTGVSTRSPSTQVLTYVDSSASRITAAGRTGFFMSGEILTSGFRSAPCANWFQAGPLGGTPVVRDEWSRLNLLACRSFSTALYLGRALVSAWYGDLFAVGALSSILHADTSLGRIYVGPAIDTTLLSQRAATDSIRQDRRATFKFASGTLTPNPSVREAGILLRGAVVTAGQAVDSGYLLVSSWDDYAAAALVRLYRVVGQVETLIAELDPLVGITLNTDFDLRLVVDNTSIPNPQNGAVVLKAYLASTQIALVSVAAPGITVNGVGTVTDSSSFRVLNGAGEGLHFANPASSARRVEAEAWIVGGLITPVDLDILDLASIAIPLESEGVTGTLALPYSVGVREAVVTQNLVHELDSDHRWRGACGSGAIRRVWDLDMKAATPDELDTFELFFDEHEGLGVPFHWTPPGVDEVAIVARFWTDAPQSAHKAPNVRGYATKILECLS
jgi:hypothetical protein